MQNLFGTLISPVSLFIFLLTGCVKENKLGEKQDIISLPVATSAPLDIDLVHFAMHIEDKDKMRPTGGADLLWNNRGHEPILAPDGHQLSLDEFNMVSGKARITCMNQGTKIVISLHGLIPDGAYSFWVLTFKLPGFHGDFNNLTGNGVLGPLDGNGNVFTASPDRTAFLQVYMPPGSLSIFGTVDNCLCSEYEVLLLAAYHSKNGVQTGNPVNDNSWVGQFAFSFLGHP